MSETFMHTYMPTVLVGGATFLLAAYLFRKRESHRNTPPGPRGIPLYGNLPEIKKHDVNGPGIFDKWSREYGDIYSIRMGSYPAVVLNTLKLVREAYIKHGDKTSGRFTNIFFYKHVMRITNYGISLNEGQKWRENKRTALHALRDFGMGKKSMEKRIQEEAMALVQYFDTVIDTVYNPRVALHNAFTNVIISIIYGDRYEYDDAEFQELSDLLYQTFTSGGMKNMEVFVPVLTFLIPITNFELFRLLKVNKQLLKCITNAIQRHRDQFDPEEIRSFIDIYLKAEADGELQDTDSEKNLFMTIFDLFFAGSETGTTTTRWAILFLINNPHVQQKCQQVIKEVIGQETPPSGADRANMPYIEATIHEVQRLANIVPAGPMHRAEETFELGGYTIPKDTLIIANLHKIHKSPEHWDDPESFKPERWIDADGKLIKNEAFIPFGIGPRECIGRNLAMQEMFIIMVSLLQKFTFKAVDPDNLPKPTGHVGLTHMPHDFNVVITRW